VSTAESAQTFQNWHGRLAAALTKITTHRPDCAMICRELRELDFDLPVELRNSIPELPHEALVSSEVAKLYFRKQCDHAVELINTIILALKHHHVE
jgi:hypothetical protein